MSKLVNTLKKNWVQVTQGVSLTPCLNVLKVGKLTQFELGQLTHL